MPSFTKKITIHAPANAVWQTIRRFDGIEKFIPIFSCSSVKGCGVGAKRTCVIKSGGQIFEKLDMIDEEKQIIQYSIIASPLPFKEYIATMRVRNTGIDQCEFEWSSTFIPSGASEEETVSIINELFSMGLNGLKKLHEC